MQDDIRKYREKVKEALAFLFTARPALASIAANTPIYLMEGEGGAYTDGSAIYLHKDIIEQLEPRELAAVIGHEVMHILLMHPLRFKRFLERTGLMDAIKLLMESLPPEEARKIWHKISSEVNMYEDMIVDSILSGTSPALAESLLSASQKLGHPLIGAVRLRVCRNGVCRDVTLDFDKAFSLGFERFLLLYFFGNQGAPGQQGIPLPIGSPSQAQGRQGSGQQGQTGGQQTPTRAGSTSQGGSQQGQPWQSSGQTQAPMPSSQPAGQQPFPLSGGQQGIPLPMGAPSQAQPQQGGGQQSWPGGQRGQAGRATQQAAHGGGRSGQPGVQQQQCPCSGRAGASGGASRAGGQQRVAGQPSGGGQRAGSRAGGGLQQGSTGGASGQKNTSGAGSSGARGQKGLSGSTGAQQSSSGAGAAGQPGRGYSGAGGQGGSSQSPQDIIRDVVEGTAVEGVGESGEGVRPGSGRLSGDVDIMAKPPEKKAVLNEGDEQLAQKLKEAIERGDYRAALDYIRELAARAQSTERVMRSAGSGTRGAGSGGDPFMRLLEQLLYAEADIVKELRRVMGGSRFGAQMKSVLMPPSKKMPLRKGKVFEGPGRVYVLVDTSSSVSDEELKAVLGFIKRELSKARPTEIIVIPWSGVPGQPIKLRGTISIEKLRRGMVSTGATEPSPVLRIVERMAKPNDVVILISDMVFPPEEAIPHIDRLRRKGVKTFVIATRNPPGEAYEELAKHAHRAGILKVSTLP